MVGQNLKGQTDAGVAGLSRRQAMLTAGLGMAAVALTGSAASAMSARRVVKDDPKAGGPGAEASEALGQGVGFYRARIGSIPTTIVSDGFSAIAPVQPLFAPEGKAEEVAAVLRENFLPEDKVNIDFNTVLLRIGGEVILVDTGSGISQEATIGRLLGNLMAAGVKPAQVTGIIITHAHRDHLFGAVQPDGRASFPNAKVFISKTEHDFWMSPNPDLSGLGVPEEWKKAWVSGTQSVLGSLKGSLQLVAPGDKIVDGIELVGTPGHTPGHMSLVVSSGKDRVLIAGDLAHNHALMFAKPEWTVAFDSDKKQAIESRKKMFDRAAADRLRVLAYHMPFPGVGHISRQGSGYRWNMEPWAWTA